MIGGCHRTRRLLDQRVSGLSTPERLRLEDHLQGCPRCAADGVALTNLAALADFDPPGLRSRARDRVIERAIQDGLRPAEPPARARRWRVALAGAGALAVVAATFAIARWVAPGDDPAAVARDRVLAGALEGGGQAHRAGAALTTGVELTATTACELALGHARVALAPASTFTWHPEQATLALRTGRLRASVDPEPRLGFRIATPDFVAMVVGTELEVSPAEVQVFSGAVTILAPDGEIVVRRLVAGESWRRVDLAAADPPPAAEVSVCLPALESASAGAEPDPTGAAPEPDPTSAAPRAPATVREPRPPAIDTVLAAARSHLAGGEIDAAEKLIAEAMATATRPRHRAEAATLHAEVALVTGDHDQAVRRYLEVADRYHDLGAGENALFAAARIEATRGHHQRAAELLRIYLDRYPNGRFRAEAGRRLDRL